MKTFEKPYGLLFDNNEPIEPSGAEDEFSYGNPNPPDVMESLAKLAKEAIIW